LCEYGYDTPPWGIPYYRNRVKHTITFLFLAVLLMAGCDRGTRPKLVGTAAPDFTVTDSQRTVALDQFRGRVVVLNFWATWCPPCVEEFPSLIEMQHRMKDKVTVLAISTDDNEAAYRKFLVDHNVDLLTVRDGAQRSNRLYGTFGFPETYIIDKSGVIRRKFIGPVDWTSAEIITYLNQL